MRTKRLGRPIVSPAASSALTYATIGFVGGLLWLELTARAPSLAIQPIVASVQSASARPLLAPTSGRVTLQDAIESVRQFADAPGLVLEGGFQSAGAGSRRADLFSLESISPTRGEELFTVDARTAEVVEATFRGRMAPAEEAVDLSPGAAETVAAQFARIHFWGFDQLVLVDWSMRTGESGTVYSFKWGQLAPDSLAELPVSVSVAVMGRSGQVVWYLGQRDALQIDARPAVDQTRAVEIARTWLLPRDRRWLLDRPASVRLQVLYDDDDRQHLIWSVLFQAREDGARSTIRLLLDAQTGTIIQGV